MRITLLTLVALLLLAAVNAATCDPEPAAGPPLLAIPAPLLLASASPASPLNISAPPAPLPSSTPSITCVYADCAPQNVSWRPLGLPLFNAMAPALSHGQSTRVSQNLLFIALCSVQVTCTDGTLTQSNISCP